MKRIATTEHQEQKALFEWAEAQKGKWPELRLLFAIPNAGGYTGGYGRNVARVLSMLAEGVKPGVPDICLPVARGQYHGLFIELKTEKGKATSIQQAWILALREEGYCTAIRHGWPAAASLIEKYLEGNVL